MIRAPTDQEYSTFTGASCTAKWKLLEHTWACPACRRTKRQIMKWIVKEQRWAFNVGEHHCHSLDATFPPFYPPVDYAHGGIDRMLAYSHFRSPESLQKAIDTGELLSRLVRFKPTIICYDCNTADGAMKRKLRLPKSFSYAPWEISQFVTATNNAKHQIDHLHAELLYNISFENDRKRGVVRPPEPRHASICG